MWTHAVQLQSLPFTPTQPRKHPGGAEAAQACVFTHHPGLLSKKKIHVLIQEFWDEPDILHFQEASKQGQCC